MSDEKIDFTSQIMIWASKNIKYVVIGAVIGITIPLSWNYYQYNGYRASNVCYTFVSVDDGNL